MEYPLAIVENLPPADYPFANGDVVCLLGEITHMPGHVVIALKDGRVLYGYHANHFRKLKKSEL